MDEDTRVTQVSGLSAAPQPSHDACLVLIYPPGPALGKRFELPEAGVIIGRGHDCGILLDRDAVSRRHARIERSMGDGGGWRVIDLDSTNGSYVNDVPIRNYLLRDGDRLKIGNAIFKFLTGGNVETAYYEEIYRMTIIDGLTQAYNKRYFVEQLERELARCGRNKRPLSLLMFDIDHFKKINDTHGHLTGDHVLKEMAARVRRRVRKDEIFARYGGEEFAVVLPEASREQAIHVAETLRTIVAREPFEFEHEQITVTISIGVATIAEEIPAGTFVKTADDCLYRAKRGGRNQVCS
jgi:two-component system, cell cycle response regulator